MKKIVVFISLSILLFSCGSGNGNREVSEYVSAFLNGNNNAIMFGKADLKMVLDKAAYKDVPKFGALIEDQIKTIEKSLNINC